jgi:urate oxidase
VQVSASEIPYAGVDDAAFAPAGPERAIARVELTRASTPGSAGPSSPSVLAVTEATAGLRGFRLLRLGGSAFEGFVRDEYTTLPDITNRPLHMWLDLDWRHSDVENGFSGGTTAHARRIVRSVFREFESGSIQQIIYKMGTRMLEEIPTLAEVHLEANNRTWDTVAERGDELGVYTDARPPYGCLGLRLTR